jgi:GntR family transcriptional regulator
LNSALRAGSIYAIMIHVQPDSPVPVHEQITSQIMAAVASGALKAGATFPEYRAFAQELLTNPQVVARAYGDLEWEGVLRKHASGGMEVVAGADVICRVRLQDVARKHIGEAVRQAVAYGLPEAEIQKAVQQALTVPAAKPLAAAELQTAIKKTPHVSRHRDSQDIKAISPPEGRGSP